MRRIGLVAVSHGNAVVLEPELVCHDVGKGAKGKSNDPSLAIGEPGAVDGDGSFLSHKQSPCARGAHSILL